MTMCDKIKYKEALNMNKMKKITLLLLLLFSSLVISSNIKAGETSPDLYISLF